jgi:hypothetical protein
MADERKDEPKRAASEDAVRMDLMKQAQALQFLAAQATADAMRLPDQRLDEMHDAPLTQVFERVGPDGKVYARVNANGEEVKAKD